AVIPDYAIVAYDPADTTGRSVVPCGAGMKPIGVSIPSDSEMMPDGNGGFVPRTGWQIGEAPTIYDFGELFVIVGSGKTISAGDEVVAFTLGTAQTMSADTFAAWALAATPANTDINAAGNQTITDIKAAFAARELIVGKALTSGTAGQKVVIKVKA
ncbi:MAG: hypothetical protein K8E24_012080, partial [Methanobacterium paludis]|nr:hypothetical protein [Methanobacterium paludis]